MSRTNNWVRIDKNIVQVFKTIEGPFSRAEALLSFSIDINCGCLWSVAGYAKCWKWSREKVSTFINGLQSEQGFTIERGKDKFRHPIHLILNEKEETEEPAKVVQKTESRPTLNQHLTDTRPTQDQHITYTQPTVDQHGQLSLDLGLRASTDTQSAVDQHLTDTRPAVNQQITDTSPYTTNKTETKTKKKPTAAEKKLAAENVGDLPFYLSKNGKKLSGEKLSSFEAFWESFNDKRGKAPAADAWLKIKGYEHETFKTILEAAKVYAATRQALIAKGSTPKMAEGWLTARRYEDAETPAAGNTPHLTSKPDCGSCNYFIRKSCKGNKDQCSSFQPHPTKA